ncbi:MAG: deoxyribodipyrimidine photo-lyase, partial [Candidatus Thorarchaeota archaeon]
MKKERIRLLNEPNETHGPIIYWMSRDQRIHDNWALLFAQELGIKKKQPLIVLFCLQENFLNATPRIYNFMLEGLELIDQGLKSFNIEFILLQGNPESAILEFTEHFKIDSIITDFSPLKIKREWINKLLTQIKIPFYEVDTHNIIPCWELSNKKEYAAYTLRSQIQKKVREYLDLFPSVRIHPYKWNMDYEKIDWEKLKNFTKVKNKNLSHLSFKAGESEGNLKLIEFLNVKFKDYNQN